MNTTQILVVEDEPSIAEVVDLYLKRAGYQVKVVHDGQQALETLEDTLPDLVVLDLMLPGLDGFSITRWLRDRSDLPIIILTARREESDRIAGLEMGADDYVVKPFSPQELVSRVRAVLRRTRGKDEENESAPLVFKDLLIDPRARTVEVRGVETSFTAKEFDLLYYLARNINQVFTRSQLLDKIWGGADYIDASTVTVHIRRLREKIEAEPSNPQHLLTVWGVGYKFEP